MMIINLTPHSMNLYSEKLSSFSEIKPSGVIARVAVTTEVYAVVDGISFSKSVYGEVENLPEPREGVIYIVSSLVAQRVPHRDDVFIPNESVRDGNGRIIGCRSLGRI